MPGAIIAYLQMYIVGGVGVVLFFIALPLAFFKDTRAGSLLTGFSALCCLSVALGPELFASLFPTQNSSTTMRWVLWVGGTVAGPLLCFLVSALTRRFWRPIFDSQSCDEIPADAAIDTLEFTGEAQTAGVPRGEPVPLGAETPTNTDKR